MDSFFLYRLPGECDFIGGRGVVKSGIDCGFLISSFYNRPDATFTITKQSDFTIDSLGSFFNNIGFQSYDNENDSLIFPFPEKSISKEIYLNDVDEIISELKDNEKTVYCRVIQGKEEIDITDTLLELDKEFPNAMVFCFYTPYSGTWIGATPEKLLSNHNGMLTTMALAGTRKSQKNRINEEWDKKNFEEQRLVTEYISDIFKQNGIEFSHDSRPQTKTVGEIEHLCTEFNAISPYFMNSDRLLNFLYDLSPTPALCGLPKEKALETINKKEIFSRAFYGGFMGPVFSLDNFSLYVILRSIRISGRKWCIYAGGGITSSSVAETEWEETTIKANSILKKLRIKR